MNNAVIQRSEISPFMPEQRKRHSLTTISLAICMSSGVTSYAVSAPPSPTIRPQFENFAISSSNQNLQISLASGTAQTFDANLESIFVKLAGEQSDLEPEFVKALYDDIYSLYES